MYELFKIVSVIAIILLALRDKIDEPRNVKYCCDKANETEDELSTNDLSTNELSTNELSTIDDAPSDDDLPAALPFIADETPVIELSIVDMPAAESTINDEPEEDDIVSVEDLYGDYTNLLTPSIILRLSNNTSVNNTFISRTPRNSCFGVVHASI
jgi:hypothetical protein